MRSRSLVLGLLAAGSGVLGAQSTADRIARGIAAYEALQVEAARPLFKEIISSAYQNPVSPEERVTAFKYLGASYAVLGIADTAEQFFTAALLYDPFTDLDPTKFSESELGPFNVAKSRVFNIGLRQVQPWVLDPRDSTTRYRFQFVTTHRAQVTLELLPQANQTAVPEVLFQGGSDGVASFLWDGLLRNRPVIADSTTYILRLRATSQLPGQAAQEQTQQQFFRVEHAYEPLEDTLPPLPDSLKLQDQIATLAPLTDLAKALGVGAAATTLAVLALGNKGEDNALSWQNHAAIAIGVVLVSGVVSFIMRTRNRAIPENVAENARRERQRANFNAGVVARNRAKIDRTRLILTPLTGVR